MQMAISESNWPVIDLRNPCAILILVRSSFALESQDPTQDVSQSKLHGLANMICDKCQNVLNIDILLSTHPTYKSNAGNAKPLAHHDNLALLGKSAKDGCTLCQLAVRVLKLALKRRDPSESKSVSSNDAMIYFYLARDDILVFKMGNELNQKRASCYVDGIQLYASKDDPITAMHPGAFTTRRLAVDAKSEQCFTLAKTWLETCLESHGSKCARKFSKLPTRLVDVGHNEPSHVSLHISAGEIGEWLTLSHCWGTGYIPLTTKDNLSHRIDKFQLSKIPKSFQDAILITRRLGDRYIWIDCLCILQDSPEDWQRESVRMAEIYANSVLTICADAASNPQKGIFDGSNKKIMNMYYSPFGRKENLVRLPVYNPDNSAASDIFAGFNNARVNRNGLSILHKRAWAFQEAVLSRRRLRYTCYGMLWSCSTLYDSCSEVNPHAIHDVERGKAYVESLYHVPHQKLEPRWTRGSLPTLGYATISWWYRQVNQFATRDLTYTEDRFPALSGLAKEYSDRTGYHYRAGIWVEDFRRGLLWRSTGGSINTSYSPSWSWAATVNMGVRIYDVYPFDVRCQDHIEGKEAELIEISVENLGGNMFGKVALPAKLSLRGICKAIKELGRGRDFCFLECDFGLHYQGNDRVGTFHQPKVDCMALCMDTEDDSIETFWTRNDPFVLQITRFKLFDSVFRGSKMFHTPREASFGLILERTSDDDELYRRIGMIEMPEDGTEELGWEMKTLVIV